MDGCDTGLKNYWPRAFGIFPIHNSQAARYKLGPQAYVGWGGESTAWTAGLYGETNGKIDYSKVDVDESLNMAWSYSQTLADFYDEWVNNTPLAQCIADASAANNIGQVPFSVPHKNRTFAIYSDWSPYDENGFNFQIYQSYMTKIFVIGHSGLTRTSLDPTYDYKYVRHFWNNW
jgi:hypothetical protein